VDPVKEASAQKTRLDSHTTTLAAEYAKQGKDWEAELRQRARELELIAELGMTAPAPTPGEGEPSSEDEDADTEDDEAPQAEEDDAA
jgi:capsid protein